jgi:hypothetical protein
MPAQTATDVQNMLDGSDLATVADLGSGVSINGAFVRHYAESFDISGRDARLLVTAADAAKTSIGSTITIGTTGYILRATEPGDSLTVLILETQ